MINSYKYNQCINNIDSNIFGLRLDSDPEEREYYLKCPLCDKLLLDNGLSKEIEYFNKKIKIDYII